MRAAALLDQLDGVRRTGRDRWIARCPAHADRHASLSIRELDDGRVLVHDFAGCNVTEIVAAVGLKLEDLFPDRTIDHRCQPLRRPFPAHDVLRALAVETLIAAIVSAQI